MDIRSGWCAGKKGQASYLPHCDRFRYYYAVGRKFGPGTAARFCNGGFAKTGRDSRNDMAGARAVEEFHAPGSDARSR